MTAHRAWSVVGVTAASGHSSNGLGLCAFDWKAGGVSLLGAGTLGATSTDPTWSLPQAINGSTAANNGWYSGNSGFAGARIWYDFGALTFVDPDTMTMCSLNGFPWTVGQTVSVEWTDDDPAGTPTWTPFKQLSGYLAADNNIMSFLLTPFLGVARLSSDVIEGSAGAAVVTPRLSAVVIEGTQRFLNVSRMSAVVIEGPPDAIRRRSGLLIA